MVLGTRDQPGNKIKSLSSWRLDSCVLGWNGEGYKSKTKSTNNFITHLAVISAMKKNFKKQKDYSRGEGMLF